MESHTIRKDRLRFWILIALLINIGVLYFLFSVELAKRHGIFKTAAPIIFTPPAPTHITPPAQPQPQTQTQAQVEEIPFDMMLNKSSTFGMPEEYADTATIGDEQADTAQEPKEEQPTESEPVAITEHVSTTEQAPIKRVRLHGMGRKTVAPINSSLSITKLASGFVDYMHNSETVNINTSDVQYAGYMQKAGWYLQNAFRLCNRPITLTENVQLLIDLHIQIDRSGKLVDCHITPLTEHRDVENLLMNVVRNAAPFPPLPAHIKREQLAIRLPVQLHLQRGTHEYNFIFKQGIG